MLWTTGNQREAIIGFFEECTTELYGCLAWKDELQTRRKKQWWFLWDMPLAVLPPSYVTVGARRACGGNRSPLDSQPLLPWKRVRCCRGNRPRSKQALSNHKGKPSMRFKNLTEAEVEHTCKRGREKVKVQSSWCITFSTYVECCLNLTKAA